MIYVFGEIELNTRLHEVRRDGQPVRVRPKVFEIILYLVAHRDRAVSKRDLLDAVWPQRAVSESVLTSSIRAAREALGDTGTAQRLIQTVHGHGYRFVAEVREVRDDVPAAPDPSPDVEQPRAPVTDIYTARRPAPAPRGAPGDGTAGAACTRSRRAPSCRGAQGSQRAGRSSAPRRGPLGSGGRRSGPPAAAGLGAAVHRGSRGIGRVHRSFAGSRVRGRVRRAGGVRGTRLPHRGRGGTPAPGAERPAAGWSRGGHLRHRPEHWAAHRRCGGWIAR